MQTKELFFALLKCELCGTVFDKTDITYDFARLMKFARKFDLEHLIADALIKSDMIPDNENAGKQCKQARLLAVYRDNSLACGLQRVKDILNNNGIDFIPLKGTVIKDIYPEAWMRTRCDIDILVHKGDVKAATNVLVKSGFEQDKIPPGQLHTSLRCNEIHLELHHSLCDGFTSTDEALSKVWEFSYIKNECEYAQAPEYLAFYVITHMRRHLLSGGCGIRPFADIYLMKKKNFFDEAKLRALLDKTNLLQFYACICNLIGYWFEGEERNELAGRLEEYLFEGGLYGSIGNQMAVISADNKSRFKTLLGRIFLDHDSMCHLYPSLKRRKMLLPAYYIVRISSAVLGKGRQKYKEKLRVLFRQTDEHIADVKKLFGDLAIGE